MKITDAELKLSASAAIIGESNRPVNGYNTPAASGKAIAAGVDITKPESAKAMADTAVAAFGGVDILVNNAALMAAGY